MSLLSRYPIHALLMLFTVAGLPVASAQPGRWTRSQGGVVIDVLDLTAKAGGYTISLREGFGKPVYASGFCAAGCDKTTCGVRHASGKTGLIELTPRGNGIHYRSAYDGGRSTWEGDFYRSAGGR